MNRMRALLLVAAGATAGCGLPAQAAASELEQALRGLAQADEAVLRVGFGLASANAERCSDQRPDIGALLQDLAQYPASIRQEARAVLGLQGDLGFTAVAEGSPADLAGITPGMALLAINGTKVAPSGDGRDASYARLLAVEAALAEALADGKTELTLRGAEGNELRVTVEPRPACAVRFRVQPDGEEEARADDRTIEVATGLIAEMRNDGELAAILGHELAHVVLHHFVKQRAAEADGRSSRKLVAEQEAEADRLSVWLMRDAGYDPQHAVELWTHFAALQHSFLAFNPRGSRKDRRERIAEEIAIIRRNERLPHGKSQPALMRNHPN